MEYAKMNEILIRTRAFFQKFIEESILRQIHITQIELNLIANGIVKSFLTMSIK